LHFRILQFVSEISTTKSWPMMSSSAYFLPIEKILVVGPEKIPCVLIIDEGSIRSVGFYKILLFI